MKRVLSKTGQFPSFNKDAEVQNGAVGLRTKACRKVSAGALIAATLLDLRSLSGRVAILECALVNILVQRIGAV